MFWYLVGLVVLIAFYLWFIKPLSYWPDRGVPELKPYPFVGNYLWTTLGRRSFSDEVIVQYNAMPDKKFYGVHMFTVPTLTVTDLDVIRTITIKDFDHFTDHIDAFIIEEIDPLFGRNLFALKGKRWRNMRSTLSPAFTGSKMRGMFMFMAECGDQFTNHYLKESKQQNNDDPLEVEFKYLFTRFTNDVIATTAFGIKTDSFNDPDNVFFQMGQKSLKFELGRFIARMCLPAVTKFFKIGLFPTYVNTFFLELVKDTVETRDRENIVRPDMIHLLMQARKGSLNHEDEEPEQDTGFAVVQESSIGKSNDKMTLSDEDITAQAFIFFIAGFETASVTMCFASYELATHPEIQKRLLEEIDSTIEKCDGKLTYEALQKMQYLDMIISETLRKWPPVPGLNRRCTKAYTLRAGDEEVHLEPGMNVFFPVFGIQRDPKYYSDPDKFDPERFNEENKGKIPPMAFLTFGMGPRNCIGSRFALMEAKMALFSLLREFEIVVTKRTPIPLKLKASYSTLTAEGGFWLGLKRRT